jgi:hypothetical protein
MASGKGDAAAGGGGEIAGTQAMGAEQGRIETGLGDAGLEDMIDRCRIERPGLDVAPLVDAAEHGAVADAGARDALSAVTGAPTTKAQASSLATVVLVRPSTIFSPGASAALPLAATGGTSTWLRRSAAISLRRRPPEAKAVSSSARSRGRVWQGPVGCGKRRNHVPPR